MIPCRLIWIFDCNVFISHKFSQILINHWGRQNMDHVYLIICNLFSLSLWNVISKPLSCIQCVTLFIIKQCVNVNIHFRGAKFLEYCYCLSLEQFNVLVTILFFPRKLLAHILTLICFFPKTFQMSSWRMNKVSRSGTN